MPGIDTSMYANLTPPPAIDPLGAMNKALAFRNMQSESQLHNIQAQQANRQYNDQLAMQTAQDNATTVNPDGSVTQDPNKIVSELGQTAPHLVPQAKASQMQMQQAQQEFQMKQMQDHATIAAQSLANIKDQTSLDQAKVTATQLGYPTDSWPAKYDPTTTPAWAAPLAKQAALAAMSPEQRSNYGIAQQNANTEQMKAENEAKQFSYGKQQDALHNTLESINASRQQTADVNQAYSDRYNAQKVKDIVASKDNPNQIDVNMVPVVAAEVAKIAQGGAPQHEELEHITPNDAANIMARAKQYLTSNPAAGEQGAFLKAYGDYANLIQSHANSVIQNSVGKKIEAMKGRLAPEDYQSLKSSYVDNPYGPDNQGRATQIQAGNANHPALKNMSDSDLFKLKAQLEQSKNGR